MVSRSGAAVLALVLAGLALVAGTGCDEESASDASPADALAAVTEAGAETFAEPTLSLDLRVASPGAHYEARGLIEPEEGRFRVELGELRSRGNLSVPVVGTGPAYYVNNYGGCAADRIGQQITGGLR